MFYLIMVDQKVNIFELPTHLSSCKRSLWTTPNMISIESAFILVKVIPDQIYLVYVEQTLSNSSRHEST